MFPAFCAVLQGGLFGLCGMMPPRYTQAVMTGQGVGGTFACLADIISKLGKYVTDNCSSNTVLLLSGKFYTHQRYILQHDKVTGFLNFSIK